MGNVHFKKYKKRGIVANTKPSFSKYAYTKSKNVQINTTKNKRKLVHAKSKSIPQNLFSSSLNEYQNEETNTYQYLSNITHFDQNTLRLLHLRFNYILFNELKMNEDQLAVPSNNKLSINAISRILGLPSHCILVKRFFGYMDQHSLNEISFRVFARTMSVLSDKASISEKCKLSFNLYDINNDDVIDCNELKQIINDLIMTAKEFMDPLLLKLISKNNTSFINKLISNTMKLFELDNNGNITYSAYCSFIEQNPRFLRPFTLNIEELLDFEAEQRRMKRISIDSLKKKKLTQMIIGQDPKKKYNKKWKTPQFIKSLSKDKIQIVSSIKDAEQIYIDLDQHKNGSIQTVNEPLSDEQKEKEEKEKIEQIQSTIDFLYDD